MHCDLWFVMALSDGVDNSSLQLLLFVQFASLEYSSLKLGSLNPKPFMFIFFPINLNIDEMFAPFDIVSCQLSSFSSASFIVILQFHIIIQWFSKCVLFQFSTFWDMAPPIVPLHNFKFWTFFNFQICFGTFHVSSDCDFDCPKSSCDVE